MEKLFNVAQAGTLTSDNGRAHIVFAILSGPWFEQNPYRKKKPELMWGTFAAYYKNKIPEGKHALVAINGIRN